MIKRIIIYTFISIIIFLSVFYTFNFLININKPKLIINTNPQDASIYINGKKINKKNIYLEPGNYQVSATKDNYYESRIFVAIKNPSQEVDLDLTEIPETIDSLIQSERYQEVIDKYPLIQKLPYDNSLINISYDSNSTIDDLTISVDASNGYRQGVINKIKALGYNPAEYNIKFNNYENPFEL